jgi:hypothetical protein
MSTPSVGDRAEPYRFRYGSAARRACRGACRVTAPPTADVLQVLRQHSIGAFNGTQSACSSCRTWMTNDEYRQHLAELIAKEVPTRCSHRFPDGTSCRLSDDAHVQVPGLAAVHNYGGAS